MELFLSRCWKFTQHFTTICLPLPRWELGAAIEHVMVEKVGDTGTLGGNVKAFLDAGYIAQKSVTLFKDLLIESGQASMYRGYLWKPTDIAAILDITEGIIETIYIHPDTAKVERIPPRKKPR